MVASSYKFHGDITAAVMLCAALLPRFALLRALDSKRSSLGTQQPCKGSVDAADNLEQTFAPSLVRLHSRILEATPCQGIQLSLACL